MKAFPNAAVWLCAVIWVACVAYGFVAFHETAPTGDGFTRGYNRLEAFFQWQLAALLAATIGFVIGHLSSASDGVKRAGRWPLFISGGFFVLVIALFIGAIVFARL